MIFKNDFTYKVTGGVPLPVFSLSWTHYTWHPQTEWLNPEIYLALSFAGPVVQFLNVDELDVVAGQRRPYVP